MTEPTTTPIRLLIADDHPVFRDGLASLLDPLPGIDVVARASDGAEAVALVDEHRPDVVVMDVQMPVHERHRRHPRGSSPRTPRSGCSC